MLNTILVFVAGLLVGFVVGFLVAAKNPRQAASVEAVKDAAQKPTP